MTEEYRKMEEKKCPVDRGELLVALECCGEDCTRCSRCPYPIDGCAIKLPNDALAYIRYLEERLGLTG